MADRDILFTNAAAQDLDDIWNYTAQVWSPLQAETYLAGIQRTIQTLAEMPEIGRLRTEITPPVRTHPSAEHLIIYQFDALNLTIIRIVHNRRHWSVLLSD